MWYLIPDASQYEINVETHEVRNIKTQVKLKGSRVPGKYQHVCLIANDDKPRTFYIHRILGQLLIPKLNSSTDVINHKNGIKSDNRLENLEWVTYIENSRHAIELKKSTTDKLVKYPKSTKDVKAEEFKLRWLRIDANRLFKEKGAANPIATAALIKRVLCELEAIE